ncbi:MAG: hypothetical protein AB1414_06945 [bacterium]
MQLEDWQISFPKALLWDYKYPPDKNWALQRIAQFFPVYGHDFQTINALYSQIEQLDISYETREAIKLYYRIYQEELYGKVA